MKQASEHVRPVSWGQNVLKPENRLQDRDLQHHSGWQERAWRARRFFFLLRLRPLWLYTTSDDWWYSHLTVYFKQNCLYWEKQLQIYTSNTLRHFGLYFYESMVASRNFMTPCNTHWCSSRGPCWRWVALRKMWPSSHAHAFLKAAVCDTLVWI